MVAKLQTTYTARSADPGDLMDHLLQIIDSKIQYQEFRINQAVKSYVDIDLIRGNTLTDLERSTFAPLIDNNRKVLEKIDLASQCIKLFYILRSRLNHTNAKVVFNLINDKKFQDFTPEGLTSFFDHPWMHKLESA